MKKLLYTAVIALLGLTSYNLKAQSVSYTYVRNDPFDMKNFSGSIDPFFIDINGHNSYAFGWGLRGEYMMGKRLMFNADGRFGFGTNLFRKSNNNTLNYFYFEGGMGLILLNKARNRNLPIILSQSTSGNVRTTVSIRGGVPAKVRTIIALHGGFYQYTNSFKLDAKSISDSILTFNSNGVTTTMRDASAGKNSSVFTYTTLETVNSKTVINTATADKVGAIAITSIYGGFNFRSIRNLVIDVDGYGIRSNVGLSDFFIDVMFAPVVALKNFKGADGVTYDVKYQNKTPFGWRIGQFIRHPKEQGFSFKWEFGTRPGFKADKSSSIPINWRNAYFMMTCGLYIPLKIKPMYMGE
ncbi:MAG: hypothetical protein IT236_00105 [Bacteroidia bacterium]|nr:hypothetical protein [Bacteroidia bacterium]